MRTIETLGVRQTRVYIGVRKTQEMTNPILPFLQTTPISQLSLSYYILLPGMDIGNKSIARSHGNLRPVTIAHSHHRSQLPLWAVVTSSNWFSSYDVTPRQLHLHRLSWSWGVHTEQVHINYIHQSTPMMVVQLLHGHKEHTLIRVHDNYVILQYSSL